MITSHSFSLSVRERQLKLKSALQGEDDSKKLENLAAALISRLLDVSIFVAKSGFQHGGDAGPAGQQGRRFRIEAKKYSDNTRLDDRELLGEIDHAFARDEALEAWILVATRNVSEQLATDLIGKGERLGVPVIILGWTDDALAPLAALCAYYPDLVEELYSTEAGALARALAEVSSPTVDRVRQELQAWSLGFASLRRASHNRLDAIWASPRTSNAELGQDAAGGAVQHKIQRKTVLGALDAWWAAPSQLDAPAAVLGWDGVGKTWAVLNWLVERKDDLPIVLVIPSSAAAGLTAASETAIKRFLGTRLHVLTGMRDHEYWVRRLDLLLKRPVEEGAVLTLFFDGLNQEPSVPWLKLLKALQAEVFSGRIRVIVSTRNHYFDDKLGRLRGLVVPAVAIPVETYDTKPGGELDQMLACEGISRDELHPDLVELARTPRLLKLVIKFKDRLVHAGQVTVHRLLWEYGRDTFGERAGQSFSEKDWRDWLRTIAETFRQGIKSYSVKGLSETDLPGFFGPRVT